MGADVEKGECHLKFSDLLDYAEGQLLVLTLPHRFETAAATKILERLKQSPADGVWLAASLLYRGDDKRRLARLARLAQAADVPLLATNEVLYHHPARRPLQDVLTCIREKTTIEAIGRRLEANAERHLKPADEMARLFRDFPDAIAETLRFADRISFSLDQLKYQYPDEPVPPGKTAQQHLEDLTWAGVQTIFRRRDRRQAARHPAQGARADRRAQIRALFPDRPRHRALRAQPEHPVPGPGIGGELRRLLRARHHLGRSDQGRSAVRALHLQGAAGAARHRRRFRAFAARGGDAICLSPLRPASRRDHRNRDPLSSAQRDPRRRQGAGPDRGRHLAACRHRLGQLGRRPHRRSGQAGRLRSRQFHGRARGGAGGRTDRFPAASVAACRRLCADPGPARQLCADRQCRDGRPHLHRMGQGRRRRAAHDEGRRAGAGHADLHPQMLRSDRSTQGQALEARDRPAGR